MQTLPNQPYGPARPSAPTTRLEFIFKCKNLLDLDVLSTSDPQVFVYLKDKVRDVFTLIGCTEIVRDSLNPVFSKSIQINFRFEENQVLRLCVMDIDKPGAGVEAQDHIGECYTTVNEIMASPGMSKAIHLQNNKKKTPAGIIMVSAEEVVDMKKSVDLRFHATKLDKKDKFFGKSDPFLRIFRQREDGNFDSVFKSDVLKNTLNPEWKQFQVSMQKIANGDIDRTLRIDCVDWNSDGTEDLIGSCTTCIRDLQDLAKTSKGMELINEKKKHKSKKYQNSGRLHCVVCELVVQDTFVDYIRGGMEIGLMIAVDFTASNGRLNSPECLHYQNTTGVRPPNDYIRSITAVGQILASYDSDNKFPTYGFGARLPPEGLVSHCFPLNQNKDDPEIQSIPHVINFYESMVKKIQFSGPTHLSQIIEKAIKYSEESNSKNQKYTVLLVLTDGVIQDISNTIDRIVKASTLPISIVIVGIGGANFTNMNQLDADVTPLIDSHGRKMKRDIVQFVPYRDFKNSYIDRIAEVTLEEIPDQVVGYMRANKIKPLKPVQSSQFSSIESSRLPHQSSVSPMMSASTPYPLPTSPSPYTTQSAPYSESPYPETPYPAYAVNSSESPVPYYPPPPMH
eukprot:CFRG5940T1